MKNMEQYGTHTMEVPAENKRQHGIKISCVFQKFLGITAIICIITILFSACVPAELSNTSFADPSTDDIASDSLPESPLPFPDISTYPALNTPISYEWGDISIPMEYDVKVPSEKFLGVLRSMNEEDAQQLMDKENCFVVGDSILFFANAGYFGESRVLIEHSDGQVEEILTILRPIYYMRFLPEYTKVVLCVWSHFSGELGAYEYYTWDLATGNIELAPYMLARNIEGEQGFDVPPPKEFHDIYEDIYCGHHYLWYFQIMEGTNLYLEESEGKFIQILSQMISLGGRPALVDKRMFCLDETEKQIFSTDLYGADKEIVYASEEIINNFFAESQDKIIVFSGGNTYLVSGDKKVQMEQLDSFDSDYSFTEEGIYLIHHDGTLRFWDWSGNRTDVFTSMTYTGLLDVIGEWVYFYYYANEAYLYGKIRLNGTGLRMLA